MGTDLSSIFPIQSIEQDFLIAGNGDITSGWELMLPPIFSMDVTAYNSLYEDFVRAFLKLPTNSIVHIQNFYYTGAYDHQREVASFCLNENQKLYLGRPVLHHHCRLYVTFTNTTLSNITAERNIALKMWNYLAKQPFKDIDRTIQNALVHQDILESSLKSIGRVTARKMDSQQLKSALWDYWNVSYDQPGTYASNLSLPPYAVEKGHLRIGQQFVGMVSMVNQGATVFTTKVPNSNTASHLTSNGQVEQELSLAVGAAFPVALGLPINHIVNTTFTIQDKERMYLEFFKRSMAEGILAGFGYDPSVKKVEAIKAFKDAAANRDFTLCKASFNLVVTASDPDHLQQHLRQAAIALDRINDCHSWIENHETLSLFIGSSPGYARGNYRTFDTVVEHAVCYVPMESHYISDLTGNLYVDRFGNPVVIDLWDSPHTQNRNGVVEGGSGTGKSFWVNGLVDEDLEKNTHVIILDVGHSYRDLCTFNKGLYLDSSDRSTLSFNIFQTKQDDQGNWILTSDKKVFIHAVLLAMWQGSQEATMEVHSILKDLVDKFYDYVNTHHLFPVFQEFFKFIDYYEENHFKKAREKFFDFESLRTVFEGYAFGEYKDLLNNTNPIPLHDEPFIVFDIESIETDQFVFPVIGLIIMELVMDKIRALRGCRKRFIIDEGWKVLQGELREFVEYLYRTFRKNEGSILLATQDINDFEQVANADAMLSNSDTLVLMRRAARKNYGDLQRWLSLTDHDITLMKDMKKRDEKGYREFFLKQGDHSRIFRYEVSEKSQAVYSSKGAEKAEIQRHFERYGNLGYAINQFVENKRAMSNEQ